tara:strand:- start:1270 stop:1494 length:225 start_codon:yes stop_codon:yes gene_type:complete
VSVGLRLTVSFLVPLLFALPLSLSTLVTTLVALGVGGGGGGAGGGGGGGIEGDDIHMASLLLKYFVVADRYKFV